MVRLPSLIVGDRFHHISQYLPTLFQVQREEKKHEARIMECREDGDSTDGDGLEISLQMGAAGCRQ